MMILIGIAALIAACGVLLIGAGFAGCVGVVVCGLRRAARASAGKTGAPAHPVAVPAAGETAVDGVDDTPDEEENLPAGDRWTE